MPNLRIQQFTSKNKNLIVGTILIICALFLVFPLPPTFPSGQLSSYSFEAALTAFSDQGKEIRVDSPTCDDKILHHGKKTKKVVVLFHGFTNCPAQFSQLDQLFWDKGYNVVIPRLPYHGHIDKLNQQASQLKPSDLINKANLTMSIASAMGDSTEVVGISAGASLATWSSINFNINKLLIIAPLIAPQGVPYWAMGGTRKFLDLAPNDFRWWDENNKTEIIGPKYAYPQFSTKALLSFFQLNRHTIDQSNILKKGSKSVMNKIILIENDEAINNQAALEFVKQLDYVFEEKFDTEVLPKELNLGHDIIDPNQPYFNPNLVYPKILSKLEVGD
ncbi:MAG: hypothetical protein AAGF07_04450 [Patescibacteria group bacterium]